MHLCASHAARIEQSELALIETQI